MYLLFNDNLLLLLSTWLRASPTRTLEAPANVWTEVFGRSLSLNMKPYLFADGSTRPFSANQTQTSGSFMVSSPPPRTRPTTRSHRKPSPAPTPSPMRSHIRSPCHIYADPQQTWPVTGADIETVRRVLVFVHVQCQSNGTTIYRIKAGCPVVRLRH